MTTYICLIFITFITNRVAPDQNITISTDKNRLDVGLVISFLQQTHWGRGTSDHHIKKSIEHSYCFGVYYGQPQIGFARVVTDFTYSAWIGDVFIIKDFQGKGYGKQLIQHIVNDPVLSDVRKFRLATKDAHDFYHKIGFGKPIHPEHLLELIR